MHWAAPEAGRKRPVKKTRENARSDFLFIGGSPLEVRGESDPGEGSGRIGSAMKSCLRLMIVSTRIVTFVSC